MRRVRVIPTLLLNNRKLVKTMMFRSPSYVGDPINALRIFNEKEVDEICILDISASRNKTSPDLEYIRLLASECFMPLSYGGGVTTLQQARELFNAGVEKIIVGSSAHSDRGFLKQLIAMVGSQSVVASLDVRRDWLGRKRIFVRGGTLNTKARPIQFAKEMEDIGVGELLLQDIDREGTLKGYDLDLVKEVSAAVNIPVVASGGAASVNDFLQGVQAGASAVAAGAMFVYKGRHRAVLITYPDQHILTENLYCHL